jgi:hypothetical protein
MANVKISALPVFTDASGLDKIPVVDVSVGDTKAYTINQILGGNYTVDGTKTYTAPAYWTNSDFISIPQGTTLERPSVPQNGMIRFNTDTNTYEFYSDTGWATVSLSGDGGAITLPNGTTVQRPLPPESGMLRFNTDLSVFEGYNGSLWGQVGGGQMYGLATTKAVSYNTNTISENITVLTGHNASSIGPMTIADGTSVVVEDGARFVII